MRLAHYSDIHVTRRPRDAALGQLVGKRIAGTLNYYLGGRRKHFAHVDRRIERLLEDVDAQNVDHALCTGDVTQMSFVEEFEKLASLYGDRLAEPARHTVIPGNHDRYTPDAVELFEAHLGAVAPPSYPHVKRIAEHVTLVLLDVSRPCALWDSSGLCGGPQLVKLRDIIADRSLADDFVIVGLHYGLLRSSGAPDRFAHGIRDWRSLLDVLDDPAMHVDLILHGHMHRPYLVKSARRTIVCAGSATDLHGACGYNIYDIDVEQRTFVQTRRTWNVAADRYA